jgi:hypothetical protein
LKLCVTAPDFTSATRLTLAALATVTGIVDPMSTQSGADSMIGREARRPPGEKKYGG